MRWPGAAADHHQSCRIGVKNSADALPEAEQGKLATILAAGLEAQTKLIEELLEGSAANYATIGAQINQSKGVSDASKAAMTASVESAAATMR